MSDRIVLSADVKFGAHTGIARQCLTETCCLVDDLN
jgi:hypothetical protein